MRKIAEVLEAVVVVAILLVLVHTFLDDYCHPGRVAGGHARAGIIWAGLGFDVFFTVEFLTRLYLALTARQGVEYFS